MRALILSGVLTVAAAANVAAPALADQLMPPGWAHVAEQADYPMMNRLEQTILGQTYPQDSMNDRLNRLETKAFGEPSVKSNFDARTDALDTYVQTHYEITSVELEKRKTAPAAPNSEVPKVLSDVGNSLVGLTVGGLPTAQPPQLLSQSRAGADDRSPERALNQIDPLVYLASPPPPNARFTTQLGWCEVQVLGRTYPELHLEARLEQLSRVMNFRPGTSPLALMDDMGPMIKAIESNKQQAPAVGANPNSRVE